MTRPEARWAGGICKTCGQYTHSCKCEHPGSELFKSLFAAPQGGEHSMAGPAHDGEPAVAASWIDSIPTAADGVTCRIQDVRRAFSDFKSAQTEVATSSGFDGDTPRMDEAEVKGWPLREGRKLERELAAERKNFQTYVAYHPDATESNPSPLAPYSEPK